MSTRTRFMSIIQRSRDIGNYKSNVNVVVVLKEVNALKLQESMLDDGRKSMSVKYIVTRS